MFDLPEADKLAIRMRAHPDVAALHHGDLLKWPRRLNTMDFAEQHFNRMDHPIWQRPSC